MELKEWLQQHNELAVAFSGGVDSAYLLCMASEYSSRVTAYYVKTPFQPEFELHDAEKLAGELQIPLRILPLPITSDPEICRNTSKRCYFCKKRMFQEILTAASGDGFTIIADGTNASDQTEDRPGMAALTELSICSPLRECGLNKEQIRILSRKLELFTWDKPAYACLATRIAPGESITLEKLQKTERSESFLFSLGFRDFRIRMKNGGARIQIRREDTPLWEENRSAILKVLMHEYDPISLDTVFR